MPCISVERNQTSVIHSALASRSISDMQVELGKRSHLVIDGVDLTIARAHLQPFSKATITLTNGACVVLDCTISQDSASGVLMEIEGGATLVLKRVEAVSHFSAVAFVGSRQGTLRIGLSLDQRVVDAPPIFGFAAGDCIDWATPAPVGHVAYQPNAANSGGSLHLFDETGALLGRATLVGEYAAADFNVRFNDSFCQLQLAVGPGDMPSYPLTSTLLRHASV